MTAERFAGRLQVCKRVLWKGREEPAHSVYCRRTDDTFSSKSRSKTFGLDSRRGFARVTLVMLSRCLLVELIL